MAYSSLKDLAYQTIKSKIIQCEYLPGSFLSETFLMSEIDASRTPIREALNKLEQENLVRILPKKGVIVADISINEVNMIFEARLLIEPYIVENYKQYVNQEKLIEIQRQFIEIPMEEASYTTVYRMDDLLHRIISDACPNRYLNKHLDHVYDQNNRLRMLAGRHIHKRQQTATQEHIELIDAILNGSNAEAAKLMRQHLMNSKDAAIVSLLSADMPTRNTEI